ncbi:MAG: hypothetical protein EB027_05870, partial [Actinobacteria bacterium]|nr:hypothetical protein [Actinomycetota bacterium]
GDLDLEVSGPVSQSGALTVGGTTTITALGQAVTLAHAGNDFGGAVAVRAGALTLNDVNALDVNFSIANDVVVTAGAALVAEGSVSTSGKGVRLQSGGAMSLGAISAPGALTLTAAGPITQASGALAVTGVATVNAGVHAVDLTAAANRFGGAVGVTGGAVSLRDTDALQITLAASGAASVTAMGAVQVAGTVTGSASHLTIDSRGATAFGRLTVGGDLRLEGRGAVSQTGALEVAGATVLAVDNQTVVLADATNDFGGTVSVSALAANLRDRSALSVALDVSDASQLVSGGALAVSGAVGGLDKALSIEAGGALSFSGLSVSGALDVKRSGAISQSSAISIGGTTTITATAANVNLGLPTNDFARAVTVTGAAVSIRDANSLQITLAASGESSVAAGGALDLTAAVGSTAAPASLALSSGATAVLGTINVTGGLSLVSQGEVSQPASATLKTTGTVSISAAGQRVTLANAGNDFGGALSLASASATVRDANALTVALATSGATSLTSTAALTLSGTVSGGDLTLASGATTTFGATALGGGLALTSAGAVSQSTGSLTVGGGTLLSAVGQAVSLAREGNRFAGAVTATGGAVSLRDDDTEGLQLSLTATGASSVTSRGPL